MLNRVVLMGRLTADPELKSTPAGTHVTTFSIAVERNFTDKTTGNRPVDFIPIVAWRGTAELVCKYFAKGDMIALDGSLQTRNYQDQNGNKKTLYEVIAEQVYFTGKTENTQRPDVGISIGDFEEIESDDELPF